MGKNCDLSESEKATITVSLASGFSTLQISKNLNRDHRTIKSFVFNSAKMRKRSDKGKLRCVGRHQITSLKRTMSKMPLLSSAKLFSEAQVDVPCRMSRFRILKQIGKVKKAKKRPPLSRAHKESRLQWAKKYMKTDWSKVIFTDECRATLDGPDGFARGWIRQGHIVPANLRRQQGGGGVLFWAGIHNQNLIGPFKVDDGVKMNSISYCDLLNRKLLPYIRSLIPKDRRNTILMQDNAPSHASIHSKKFLNENGFSGNTLMDWPSCSPDLNPIENYWAVFKSKLYEGGKQYANKNDLWHGIQSTFASMDRGLIKTLTQSMDSRIVEVLSKKGNYIHH